MDKIRGNHGREIFGHSAHLWVLCHAPSSLEEAVRLTESYEAAMGTYSAPVTGPAKKANCQPPRPLLHGIALKPSGLRLTFQGDRTSRTPTLPPAYSRNQKPGRENYQLRHFHYVAPVGSLATSSGTVLSWIVCRQMSGLPPR